MTSLDDAATLASEFPPAGRHQWVGLVAKTLDRNAPVGSDPEASLAKLRASTYDGLTIEPLYTSEDAPAGGAGLPGFSPFVRGRTAAGTRQGWDVRQRVGARAERGEGAAELERGATSLVLDLRTADSIDAEVLDRLLDGVLLDLAPVVLDAGPRWAVAADALLGVFKQRSLAPQDARGSLGADPLGEHATYRAGPGLDADLETLRSWAAALVEVAPNMQLVTVDGTRFHDAGASDAQELGATIAAALAYLRLFVEAGRSVGDACGLIELRLAATADQFVTIAKVRAARRLWARVAQVAGDPDAAGRTPLHAQSSAAMMTRYDPWVNVLRTTVACFAAGVAGADSITVLPHDALLAADGTETGRRLARNTQSILAMESHLPRVIDPAGGSWYVETLTDELGETAWEWFQEIEQAGGLLAAVDSGLLAERISATRLARQRDLDTRKSPLTGLTEFPDVNEPPPPDGGDPEADREGDLGRHRYAEGFELLRQRVDRATATSGQRPRVFLATIGSAATFTARATYAKNFFEVAGLVTVNGPVSSDAGEIAAAFAADPATVACLCSTDGVYAEHATALAEALTTAGAGRVLLAGRPKDLMAELHDAGVERTIYVGCDVRTTLAELVDFLGVP